MRYNGFSLVRAYSCPLTHIRHAESDINGHKPGFQLGKRLAVVESIRKQLVDHHGSVEALKPADGETLGDGILVALIIIESGIAETDPFGGEEL